MNAINLDRGRTGVALPPVITGKNQDELRQIVRPERRVELALEEHRLFDIRRWKIAEQVMNGTVYGILNYFDPSRSDYGTNVVVETRFLTQKRIFVPIPQREMNSNKNMVPNPNWYSVRKCRVAGDTVFSSPLFFKKTNPEIYPVG
jgi:hypothetical protein